MFKKFLWLLIIICMRCRHEHKNGESLLPLKEKAYCRVLARPFSNIYIDRDLNSATVKENVSAFQPYYVYTRPTAEDLELQDGWYEVGADNRGNVLGWMQSKDVFEWKQTMCLAYTHPEGHKPVLMFGKREPLAAIIQKDAQSRQTKVGQLYNALNTKLIPEDFPIRSVEPKQAVDISSQFYLLPI